MLFHKIRNKLLTGALGVILLLGALLLFFFNTALTDRLETELQKRAVVLAVDIAQEAVEHIINEDVFGMLLNLHRHLEIEWVEYIFIVNSDGTIFASTFEDHFPSGLRGLNTVSLGQEYSVNTVKTSKGIILDVAVPILKGELGVVRLGISEEPILNSVAIINRTVLYIVIGVIIIAGLITVVLAASVTKPLSDLTNGAMRIGSGDLDHEVSVSSKDEIGQLAEAFNQMTGNLKKTTVRRDELISEIDERIKVETALKHSEKKYRDLVDNSLVGIYKTNLQGDLLFVNSALAEIFEYASADDMMSVNVQILYKNPDDRKLLIEKLKKTGKVDNLEIETITNAGNPRTVLLSATLYGDTLSGMIVDITELKQVQTALQRAEQMAVIGELATGLAHEIRNPLAGIKVSVEVLSEEHTFSEEDRAIILKSIDEIKRIETLINSLLNFARPPKPQLTAVDLNKLIENALPLLMKHQAFLPNTTGSIKIVKDFDTRIPETTADPQLLQQAFLNILLNARDAMPGGGTITVKTVYHEELNSVQISFSDTGTGINNSIMDKIFQPFFTTKPKGTGLGLPITKRLIIENEGDICVSNNPGRGAAFTLFFPVKKTEKNLTA